MKTHTRTLPFLALVGATFLLSSVGRAQTWEADPDHTQIGFSVRHMMISNVKGEFRSFKVTAMGDPKQLTTGSLTVEIDAGSIDTKNVKRDGHLKSPDFLDVAKFPTIRFKSKKITPVGKDQLKIVGALTIRNVTKDVTLEVTGVSDAVHDPWGMVRAGAHATTKISRKEFGLTWNKAMETGGMLVGDEVTISIDVELVQKRTSAKGRRT